MINTALRTHLRLWFHVLTVSKHLFQLRVASPFHQDPKSMGGETNCSVPPSSVSQRILLRLRPGLYGDPSKCENEVLRSLNHSFTALARQISALSSRDTPVLQEDGKIKRLIALFIYIISSTVFQILPVCNTRCTTARHFSPWCR